MSPPAETLIAPVAEEMLASNDRLEEHVQRMLKSAFFARADTQRRLLDYLWQHREDSLSEYAIATEALGRSSSFDSTTDASVRVQILRLRIKLKDYYLQEPGEPEMLTIPKGTHQLVVSAQITEQPEVLDDEGTDDEGRDDEVHNSHRSYLVLYLTGACSALLVALAMLGWWSSRLLQRMNDNPPMTSFWASFLRGTAPIKIILPTPIFFEFENLHSLRFRSTKVNEFNDLPEEPELVRLAEKLGKPKLDQSYTVTSDTLAAINLARYLDAVGAKSRISLDVTRDSNMTILEQADVIAFGTHQTLRPFNQYLQAMNFSLSPGEITVTNAKPAPGETVTYESVVESPERLVRPSIIALMPGRRPGVRLLMLQSRDTGAMVSFLSSSAGSNSVEDLLKQNGNPEFFEMVVETELEDKLPLRTWPVAIHSFPARAPTGPM